jgi:hypothetical protein
MSQTAPVSDLALSRPDIVQQLDLLNQRFVGRHIDQHGGASPVLREHDGTLGLLDLQKNGRRVRPKLREGPNVFGWNQLGHEHLTICT